MLHGDECCPVSDELLGRLYRQRHNHATELLLEIGAETRAELALYCYARTHLRDVGLLIATTCAQQALTRVGAHWGNELFQRAHADPQPDPAESHYALRKRVTLARFGG